MTLLPQSLFDEVPDPRRATSNKLHALPDIIMLTLCAVICGCEDWVPIEDVGCENEDWLHKFVPLVNGIPSHDTLSDVMGRIDPDAFWRKFTRWAQYSLPELSLRHLAIDGKTLRGSREHWRIENEQHWVLDMQFGEDANRSRKNHSAANLGLIRRCALNLLRQASTLK